MTGGERIQLFSLIDRMTEEQQQTLTSILVRRHPGYARDVLNVIHDTIDEHTKLLIIVADVYKTTIGGIQSRARAHREARFAAASLLYSICKLRLHVIGSILRPQGVDHTSVVYWINNADANHLYFMAAKEFCRQTERDYESYLSRLPERAGNRAIRSDSTMSHMP